MNHSARVRVTLAMLTVVLAFLATGIATAPALAATATLTLSKAVQDNTSASGYATSIIAHPGDSLTYKLTVTNTSAVTATEVIISDPVHNGQTYASCSPAPCALGPNATVNWNVGNVAAHSSTSVFFTVTLDANLMNGDQIPNKGFANASNTSAETVSNGTVVTISAPLGETTLTLSKLVKDVTRVGTYGPYSSSGTAFPGDTVRYRLTVQNTGPVAATGVMITDVVQAGQTFSSCITIPLATCSFTSSTNTVIFNVGPLAASSSQVVWFEVTINANDSNGQTINNQAQVSANNAATITSNETMVTVSTRVPITPSTKPLINLDHTVGTLGTSGATFTATCSGFPAGDMIQFYRFDTASWSWAEFGTSQVAPSGIASFTFTVNAITNSRNHTYEYVICTDTTGIMTNWTVGYVKATGPALGDVIYLQMTPQAQVCSPPFFTSTGCTPQPYQLQIFPTSTESGCTVTVFAFQWEGGFWAATIYPVGPNGATTTINLLDIAPEHDWVIARDNCTGTFSNWTILSAVDP
jgi:uncharacterized repeat protein (TIGR01451 family)